MTRRFTFRYMMYGALFGFAFPLLSTLGDILYQQLPVTLESALQVQRASRLHWVIDLAPFFLGLFASFAGKRQDSLAGLNRELERQVQARNQAIEELQSLQTSLEQQVIKRTAELEQAAREAAFRVAQLQTSAEVAHASASMLDLERLLPLVTRLISERFGFYHAGIFLLDDARDWAVLRAANSPGGERMLARGHRLRVGQEGIVGFVTGTGQARIALDVGSDAVHFANPDLPETHSEMAVPLRARGVIIGALDVQSLEINAFSREDAIVLQTLADQLAVAIDNARLFRETQRNLEEMRDLQRDARQASSAAGAERPMSFRYDGVDIAPLSAGAPALGDQAALRGVLHVPIQVGGQTLGVMELKRPGEDWSPEEVELTEAIVGRMALALENAQLFEQTRVRAQQLAALSEATLQLTGPQFDPERVLDLVVHEARRLFDADGASVWVPHGADEIEVKASAPAGQTHTVPSRLRRDQGMAGQVFSTAHALRAKGGTDGTGAPVADKPFHAALAIPMTWQGQVLGVLILTHATPGRDFGEHDEHIAQLFAAQAAATLENARLFAETQRRAQQLAAAAEIAQAATSSLDLDELLRISVELIRERFGFYHASAFIVEPGTSIAVLRESTGEAGRQLKDRKHQLAVGSRSLVGTATATGRPVVVQDVTDEPTHFKNPLLPDTRAEAVVPLVSGEQVIGALDVQSTAVNAFGPDDMDTLVTIGDQLAVAIQNARLYDKTARQARRERLVMEITSKIRAAGGIDGMLRTAVTELRQALGVSHGVVRLGSPAGLPSRDPGNGQGPNGPDA